MGIHQIGIKGVEPALGHSLMQRAVVVPVELGEQPDQFGIELRARALE